MDLFALLLIAIFVVAVLYASVGHAGASGYIAVMALAGLAPDVIKPTALVLNILVSVIATWRFHRAGHFRWRLFWPFAALAVPFAFIGGAVQLPGDVFRPLVGAVLLFSAARLLWSMAAPDAALSLPPIGPSLGIGAGLGLLSGLTGVGGGIFLSPVLLFMRWASAKETSAVAALFILVNSVAGLLGHWSSTRMIPAEWPWYAVAAVMGGTLGAYLGSVRLPVRWIKAMLATVLLVAGAKLMLV
jgi:uncharacterized membrane protein YfcA